MAGADGTPVREISLPTTDVTLVVGPEGGFDDVELDALRATGWPTIALGPHTLRAETAADAGEYEEATRLYRESRAAKRSVPKDQVSRD